MKLSKERRVLACILGLAGAVWLGDRLFFGAGPTHAGAGTIAPAATPAPEPIARTMATAAAPALAERLEGMRLALEGPPVPDDAFAIPQSWQTASEAPEEGKGPSKAFDRESFLRDYHLTGVICGPRSDLSAAVLNGGRLLRPGEQFQRLTLIEVTASGATFSVDGTEIMLRIER